MNVLSRTLLNLSPEENKDEIHVKIKRGLVLFIRQTSNGKPPMSFASTEIASPQSFCYDVGIFNETSTKPGTLKYVVKTKYIFMEIVARN